MASEMLGRSACPECGFSSAHIKIKTDKEGAHPYRHCPDCGSQYFTKNKTQGDLLRSKINSGSAPVVAAPVVAVENIVLPPIEKSQRMVFGVLV
ncbi:hypothetical protein [Undibacterium sp. Ren11W]|uniref:hypothetical protein n=1 Tax=Undibacterium sp. Ren11W TaxID=3413045 RepID=UPI003BF0A4AF